MALTDELLVVCSNYVSCSSIVSFYCFHLRARDCCDLESSFSFDINIGIYLNISGKGRKPLTCR